MNSFVTLSLLRLTIVQWLEFQIQNREKWDKVKNQEIKNAVKLKSRIIVAFINLRNLDSFPLNFCGWQLSKISRKKRYLLTKNRKIKNNVVKTSRKFMPNHIDECQKIIQKITSLVYVVIYYINDFKNVTFKTLVSSIRPTVNHQNWQWYIHFDFAIFFYMWSWFEDSWNWSWTSLEVVIISRNWFIS